MNIDERLEALVMNGELLMREIEGLKSSVETLRATAEEDGRSIRALARIAEIHEHRLTELEGESGS